MNFLKYAVFFFFIFSIVMHFISFFRLLSVKRACLDFHTVKHPFVKQIILRYTNCAKLDIKIVNTKVFIANQLNTYRSGLFRYETGDRLSILGICLIFALTIAGLLNYTGEYMWFAFASLIGCAIILTLHLAFHSDEIEAYIIAFLADYLDNTLGRRVTSYKQEAKEESVTDLRGTQAEELSRAVKDAAAASDPAINDENVIISVIDDFLV